MNHVYWIFDSCFCFFCLLCVFQKTCAQWSTLTTACPSVSANYTVSQWEDPSTAGFTTPAASASDPSASTTAAKPSSAWTVSSEVRAHWYQMSGPLPEDWGQRKLWLLCVSIPQLPCKIPPRPRPPYIPPPAPANCFYSAVMFHCIFLDMFSIVFFFFLLEVYMNNVFLQSWSAKIPVSCQIKKSLVTWTVLSHREVSGSCLSFWIYFFKRCVKKKKKSAEHQWNSKCLSTQLPVSRSNLSLVLPQVRKRIISWGNKVVIIPFWSTGVPVLSDRLMQAKGKGSVYWCQSLTATHKCPL